MKRRLLRGPEALNPWPTFVDALSAALLVLVFMITLLSIRSGQVLESLSATRATSEMEDVIAEAMAEAVATDGISVEQDGSQLRIRLSDKLLFESGAAALSVEGRQLILTLAERLQDIPGQVVVQGHTDDRSISGTLATRFPSNWELSTARATAVVRLLQDQGHLKPERLSGAGFGQYQPIESNELEEGRSKNRRIEIIVRPGDD